MTRTTFFGLGLALLLLATCSRFQFVPPSAPRLPPTAVSPTGRILPTFPSTDLTVAPRQGSATKTRTGVDHLAGLVFGENRSEGDVLVLIPGGEDDLAWAVYGETDFSTERPVTLTVNAVPAAISPGGEDDLLRYWVGVANFSTARWDWFGKDGTSEPFDTAAEITLNSLAVRDRYVNAVQAMFYCVLAMQEGPDGVAVGVESNVAESLPVTNPGYFATAPLVPSIASVTPVGRRAVVSWNHADDAGSNAERYEVWRSTGGGTRTLIGELSPQGQGLQAYTDPLDNNQPGVSSLMPGQQYEYYLVAVGAIGSGSSGYSYAQSSQQPDRAWMYEQVVDSGPVNGTGRGCSVAIVDGFPAISYCNVDTFEAMYVRALDAQGQTWGTPVTTTCPAHVTEMTVVNGQPAVITRINDEIWYCRANDLSGSSWGAPQEIAAMNLNADPVPSLQIVNGNPAFCFVGAGYDCRYKRALDADGTNWGSDVIVDTQANMGGPQLAVINGNPAIAYYIWELEELRYSRATDADGTDWIPTATIVETGVLSEPGLYNLSLVELDSRPALAYRDSGALKYRLATDSLGETWGAPVTIDSDLFTLNQDQEVSMNQVDGFLEIAYGCFVAPSSADLRYVCAMDYEGLSWTAPQSLSSTGDSFTHCSMLELAAGVGAGVAFYNPVTRDLHYGVMGWQ